jgi:hypothetical protein
MANDSDLPGLLVLHARHRPDLRVLRHDTPYALTDTYAIFKTRIIVYDQVYGTPVDPEP